MGWLAVAGCLTLAESSALAQTAFYVSPSGNDINNGLTTNTPVRTLTRAQALVRGVNATMTGDITMFLLGGTYEITAPLTLTATDSGFNGYYVNWRAFTNETPSISGGTRVTNWTQLPGSPIWSASVSSNRARALYVNEERRPRARSTGRFLDLESYRDGVGDKAGFYFPKGLLAPFQTPAQVELHTREDWRDHWVAVTNVSAADAWRDLWKIPKTIFQNVAFPPYFDDGFVIENDLSLLDEPGEWVLDRAARVLYYWPKAGENPNLDQVIMPVAERLIDVRGANSSTLARNIRFDGLTFENVNWSAPNGLGYVIVQASYFQQPGGANQYMQGGIQLHNCTRIDFLNNRIVRSGRAGLSIDANSSFINLIGNSFLDISDSGIVVGNPNQNSPNNGINTDLTIQNNLISQVGREFRGACGVDIFAAKRALVDHNHVEQVPYDGISLGYFATGTSECVSNIISNNRIEYFQMVCRDGGGIYTLGAQTNCWVTGNYLRKAFRDYGGIYHDDTSSWITTSNNVVEAPPSNGQWMFAWNAASEFGITVVSNWSTISAYTFAVTGGSFQQAQIYANANWPAGAQAVTNNAGLQPAYRPLLDQIPRGLNTAPVVSAGTNENIALTNNLLLHGNASDDGQPCNFLAFKWSKVSGPGAVYFQIPNSAATIATFSQAGTYVLNLTADDSLLVSTSSVTVTVGNVTLSTNLALNRPATASGGQFNGTYAIAYGNDGNVNSSWVSGGGGGWIVDLGTAYPISQVQLVARSLGNYDERQNIRIKASNSTNSSSFVVLGRNGSEGLPNSLDTMVVNVRDTNAYRYIRADTTAVGELRVFIATNAFPRQAGASLVATGAVWRYFDKTNDLGTSWRSNNYSDATWSNGPAMLGFGDANGLLPTTVIKSNGQWTTYFRRPFFVPSVSNIITLSARLLRDDGAVVYLNGAEVWRDNLPGGVITNLTPASAAISGTDESTWINQTFNPGALVAGTNLLAVEIHQNTNTSSDVTFDFGLSASVLVPSLPALDVARNGSILALIWPADPGLFSVFVATNLNAPTLWSPTTNAPVFTNGQWQALLPVATNGARYFRLQTN